MSTSQPTCKERIAEQMASREATLKEIYERMTSENHEISDSGLEDEGNFALAVDTKSLTTVTISWGGPADYLDILHDEDYVQKVTYRFEDWFDSASESVQTYSPLWDYAVSVIDSQVSE